MNILYALTIIDKLNEASMGSFIILLLVCTQLDVKITCEDDDTVRVLIATLSIFA